MPSIFLDIEFVFSIYTHSLGNTIQVGHLVICTPGPDICPELQICWSNCWLDIATWMLNRWLNINMSPNLLLPIIHIWQRQLYFFNSSDKKTMTLLFLDSISDSFINPFGYVFRLFFWNLTISLSQHRFPPWSARIPSTSSPLFCPCVSIVCSQSRGQNNPFKHVSSCNFFVHNVPMASFSLIWNKSQGHDTCLLC